jgi:hypothetical protein
MEVIVLKECGYEEALLGISLSYNADINRMSKTAEKLSDMDGGHNKFLESMCVWLNINAPRYWWSQFDTYRAGVTKQSESTMHTLTRRPLTQNNFEGFVSDETIKLLNTLIEDNDLVGAKANLPEAFLQRRIVCTNYKALRGMVKQRATHKLQEWKKFCMCLKYQLEFPHFIDKTWRFDGPF